MTCAHNEVFLTEVTVLEAKTWMFKMCPFLGPTQNFVFWKVGPHRRYVLSVLYAGWKGVFQLLQSLSQEKFMPTLSKMQYEAFHRSTKKNYTEI